jgi:methylmalonyl-CoA mutase
MGLSVAFDLATHRGYDSDHPRVVGDVGKAGVAIDSVEDMKILFDGIPLDKMSVSMTMNGAVLPVLAGYIVPAEEQGVPQDKLGARSRTTSSRSSWSATPTSIRPDPRCASWPTSSSTRPAHAQVQLDLDLRLSHAGGGRDAGPGAWPSRWRTASNTCAPRKAKGLDIDAFAPRLSFFFCIGMNFFMEVAKLRAARFLWAELIKPFEPKKADSLSLRTHCQTSGVSLTEKDPYNNIVRTAYEAMAAVLGGTQSLHTNSFDEAIALPTVTSARIARNTQLILQHETGVTKVVDPLAGSYYVEALTASLIAEARKLIAEVEALGGMTKAVEAGMPKLRIEEAAARKQARIDRGEEVVVGVNKFQLKEEPAIEILDVDNDMVRESQVSRLNRIRASRDEAKCVAALKALGDAARNGTGNLLTLSIEATRARATVGEISSALEGVYGRYQATIRSISGVYAGEWEGDQGLERIRSEIASFAEDEGRRPRLMVVKMGQDGHDRGAKVIATAFADLGFDVDIGPLFQTPEEAARAAIENDVHVIGVSSQAAGHKTLVPQLIEELARQGGAEVLVVVGGVIPAQDYDFLKKAGVAAIYGPGTNIPAAAAEILSILRQRDQKRAA